MYVNMTSIDYHLCTGTLKCLHWLFSPLLSSATSYSRRSTRLGAIDAELRICFMMRVEKALELFRCHFRWNIPVNPAFKRRRAENANCVVCDRCSL